MIPGEIRTRPDPLELNAGRERLSLVVVNTGDRPIQVGSHLHFPDVNPALRFDRERARGFRLDVPAGTSVRMEPGVSRTVELVALGGGRYVPGLQIREVSKEAATGTPAERAPEPMASFGRPGTDVPQPAHASGKTMRVSDVEARDNDPAEVTSAEAQQSAHTTGPGPASNITEQGESSDDTEENDR